MERAERFAGPAAPQERIGQFHARGAVAGIQFQGSLKGGHGFRWPIQPLLSDAKEEPRRSVIRLEPDESSERPHRLNVVPLRELRESEVEDQARFGGTIREQAGVDAFRGLELARPHRRLGLAQEVAFVGLLAHGEHRHQSQEHRPSRIAPPHHSNLCWEPVARTHCPQYSHLAAPDRDRWSIGMPQSLAAHAECTRFTWVPLRHAVARLLGRIEEEHPARCLKPCSS